MAARERKTEAKKKRAGLVLKLPLPLNVFGGRGDTSRSQRLAVN
jgi:hypothetical protein